ncbi:hypothetical protein [Amycolatopsis samaneae]|uniref:Excreted virulence factor EspC, type VII ESX diderm n=1 Tax=Amycolatopsis samaneae TaxID=664691 RepID=A0ABW5GL61_9PSEU
MADEFYLDEAAYDGIMTDLQSIGHGIGSSFQTLADVLLEHDGAWGTDDIGKAFAKKYLGEGPDDGARADVVALGGVEENLDKSAEIGKKNARNFASVDRETAKKMDLQ